MVEACIGVLGIQDICHFTSRDIGYYPFYFQGNGILGTPYTSLMVLFVVLYQIYSYAQSVHYS